MKQKSFTKRGRVRPICDESSRKPKKQKNKTLWRSFGFRSKDVFFGFPWVFLVLFGGPELFSFNRKGFLRNLEKPKKPKLYGEVLVSGQKMFFFGFPWVFFFFWFRFLKTKKNLGFFGFLKEVLLEVRQKTKKTQGFFVFLVRCLEYMYEQSMKKTKKPWVFLVFCLFSTKTSFKKPKKPRFFLVFKNLNQKKTKKLKENQKKTSFDLKPKLLQKVLVFWFFGFLEVSSHTSLFLFGRNSGSKIESVFHGNIYK